MSIIIFLNQLSIIKLDNVKNVKNLDNFKLKIFLLLIHLFKLINFLRNIQGDFFTGTTMLLNKMASTVRHLFSLLRIFE